MPSWRSPHTCLEIVYYPPPLWLSQHLINSLTLLLFGPSWNSFLQPSLGYLGWKPWAGRGLLRLLVAVSPHSHWQNHFFSLELVHYLRWTDACSCLAGKSHATARYPGGFDSMTTSWWLRFFVYREGKEGFVPLTPRLNGHCKWHVFPKSNARSISFPKKAISGSVQSEMSMCQCAVAQRWI